ncbi:MAG: hypothetical protein ABSA69_02320 [Verrucomicrobiota bacterium]|jgi:hypothetical protein
MISNQVWFADADGVTLEDLFPSTPFDPGIFIIIGSLLAVSLVVFIWAAFIRKPGSRPHAHHHFHPHRPAPAPTPDVTPEAPKTGWFFSRKRHRRRRRERPRNPTLAEAGGLPPIRTGEQPHTPM